MIDKYSCEYEYDHPENHCDTCKSDDCIDGRWIEAVCEYASTCDGCGELTMHDSMVMDEKTQLGYCEQCVRQYME